MQAACAHAVPQVTALLSPGHAARPLTARTALLPARRSTASARMARRWETRAATRSANSTAARLLQALVASLTARSVAVLWTAQGGGPGQRCGQAMREKFPIFGGSPVDRTRRFCGPHKEEGHVNVTGG